MPTNALEDRERVIVVGPVAKRPAHTDPGRVTDTPTRPPASFYDRTFSDDATDARLFSDIALRNGPPMIAALTPIFAGRSGPVLEIGAGTGQHAGAFSLAFPHLDWWPSDPVPEHRVSISAWAEYLQAPGRRPLDIDAASFWASDADIVGIGPLTAILAMNVIHISPLAVAEGILREGRKTLSPGGLLIFYGPFFVAGDPISPGNAKFNASLRARNAAWGIRDTDDITDMAKKHRLGLADIIPMPANNRLVVFERIGDGSRPHKSLT